MAQGSPLCSVLGCYEPDRLLMWCLSRFLACRGAAARVHFWYTPDSYDKNLPADVAPGEAGAGQAHPRCALDNCCCQCADACFLSLLKHG